ncbi:MAG: hypothetical protein KF799_08785 [Bdellovibrionales bacterium]|nr:hypothetical protein [Bdellovibrionales bacterium]
MQPQKSWLVWAAEQEQRSWDYMQENISPVEPKRPGEARPLKGIVVAALHKKDPDYYFHWVRDSAHVMSVVAEALRVRRPYATNDLVDREFKDFLLLSRDLQKTKSPFGLGEPRFTVQGQADTLPWSRPQYDGPALRALAVLDYVDARPEMTSSAKALVKQVLFKDIDFIVSVKDQQSFDIWEELDAENYHTRLVQLAALERAAAWLENDGPHNSARVVRWRAAARRLQEALDKHWTNEGGYLRSQLQITRTDGYTAKKTDLDSAVVVAVMEAGRSAGAHSVLDDRVQATVAKLEALFRQSFPINARADLGLGYGRYQGDVYYGGNPWYLVTAYYAEFYYRLARRLQEGAPFQVTPRNISFLAFSRIAPTVQAGQILVAGAAAHKSLIEDLIAKGDLILQRFQLHTPSDGQLYEQFDKTSGKPASSRGIGWSHAAFLRALFERQKLRFVDDSVRAGLNQGHLKLEQSRSVGGAT